jgi:hypothetical protein
LHIDVRVAVREHIPAKVEELVAAGGRVLAVLL